MKTLNEAKKEYHAAKAEYYKLKAKIDHQKVSIGANMGLSDNLETILKEIIDRLRDVETVDDATQGNSMKKIDIDTNSLSALLQGLHQIEGDFYRPIKALADSNNIDTALYKDLCKVRKTVKGLIHSLNPSVFL